MNAWGQPYFPLAFLTVYEPTCRDPRHTQPGSAVFPPVKRLSCNRTQSHPPRRSSRLKRTKAQEDSGDIPAALRS